MKASHLLASLALVSASLLAIVGQNAARADSDVNCSAEATAGYMKQARLPRGLMNFPAILMGQQSLYSCRVQKLYADSVQALFISRFGMRAAQLAQGFTPTNTHLCSNINQAIASTVKDIEKLEKVDSAPELGALKSEMKAIGETNCMSLISKAFTDDDFSNRLNDAFCAYRKTVEAGRPGSTSGFSPLLANCAPRRK
jgi:hypothetical protein